MKTLVVLPTYEEAANIANALRKIREALPEADILVVDDSSPDGTADIVDSLVDEIGGLTVMRRPGKNGLGSAYRDGFRHGIDLGYEVLVEMDSDGSHDPAALPEIVGAVEAWADLAIGSRYVPGGTIPKWKWHRRILSRWGNTYAAFMLGLHVRDATSGFRAYRATMLQLIDLDSVRADGYGFQIEMAWRVTQKRGRIVEVPIAFVDRELGTSKMSKNIVFEALRLVTVWGVRDRLNGQFPGRPTAS